MSASMKRLLATLAFGLFASLAQAQLNNPPSGGGAGSPVVVAPFTAGDVLVPNSVGQVVDAATLVGGQGYAVSPVGINLTGNLTLSGASTVPTQTGLFQDITVGGTSTSTSGWQSYWFFHAIDSAAANGNTPISALDVRLQLSGTQGLRNAILSYISVDVAPNPADASLQNYVSMSSLAYSVVSAKTGLAGGATFAGYAGSIWGANPDAWIGTTGATQNAVHWLGLYGIELDTDIFTGSDAAERYGIFVVSASANQAAIDDAGLAFAGKNNNAIEFGGVRHGWTSVNAFIAAVAQTQGGTSNPTAAYGVNLTSATITTDAWASTGATLDPSGNWQALSYQLDATTSSATGNGLHLSATNTPSISVNGGDVQTWNTAFNTTFTASQNGASIALFRNLNTGTTASMEVALGNSSNSPEAGLLLNGGGFTGTGGANALQLINSAGQPIVLGHGTETLRVNSTGMVAANGAVATTVTSLGPTGSHTTIQEWMVVIDQAGTTRWIPMY